MLIIMMINIKKLEALEDHGFNSDYYKPIITDRAFDGRENNYVGYRSKGHSNENL